MPESLERISWLRKRIDEQGLDVEISVDGGVCRENAGPIMRAGADILVAGSAVFGDGRIAENIDSLREAAMNARAGAAGCR
jgi:ribulose-phosphate 3-epimerase